MTYWFLDQFGDWTELIRDEWEDYWTSPTGEMYYVDESTGEVATWSGSFWDWTGDYVTDATRTATYAAAGTVAIVATAAIVGLILLIKIK